MKRMLRKAVSFSKSRDNADTPLTQDENGDGGLAALRQQMLDHSVHHAYDISIGRSGRHLRRPQQLNRQTSLESDFRVSRAAVSSCIDKTDEDVTEQLRGISSAANAYLPTSSSFLTSTTSVEQMSSFATQRPSWPSSVMLHAASSPIRGSTPTLTGVQQYDRSAAAYRSEEELASSDGGTLSVDHSSLMGQRMRSCPTLRSAFHAQRHRASMLLSMETADAEMDEFGRPRKVSGNGRNSAVQRSTSHHRTPPTAKQSPPPRIASPPSPYADEVIKGNRYTFGNALVLDLQFTPASSVASRYQVQESSVEQSARREPDNKVYKREAFTSSTSLAPSLAKPYVSPISLASSFAEFAPIPPPLQPKPQSSSTSIIRPESSIAPSESAHDLPPPLTPTSASVASSASSLNGASSLRAALARRWETYVEDVSATDGSPFRFPALCLAAAQQTESACSSPSLSSARNHAIIIRSTNAHAELSALSTSTPTPPTVTTSAVDPTTPQLGSPIQLTSEQPYTPRARPATVREGARDSLCSSFSSASDSSESCIFEMAVPQAARAMTRNAHSDSRLYDATQAGPAPQAFFESRSMPTIYRELPSLDVGDDEEGECGDMMEEVELDEDDASPPVEDVGTREEVDEAIVSTILAQQQLTMERLRSSSRWSPSSDLHRRETVSRTKDELLLLRSSWTLAAAADEDDGAESDQRLQIVSSSDLGPSGVAKQDLDVGEGEQSTERESDEKAEFAELGFPLRSNAATRWLWPVTTTVCVSPPPSSPTEARRLVEKATQTDCATTPRRPARLAGHRSKGDLQSPAKTDTPIRYLAASIVPDICIFLASPRKGDDQEPDRFMIVEQHQQGADDDDVVDTGRLLPPGADQSDDEEDESQDMGLGIGVLQCDMDEVRLPSVQASSLAEQITNLLSAAPRTSPNPPPAIDPALASSLSASDAPMRESTTTAAIEAMLAQLCRAQEARNVPPLSMGGRRHKRQLAQHSAAE